MKTSLQTERELRGELFVLLPSLLPCSSLISSSMYLGVTHGFIFNTSGCACAQAAETSQPAALEPRPPAPSPSAHQFVPHPCKPTGTSQVIEIDKGFPVPFSHDALGSLIKAGFLPPCPLYPLILGSTVAGTHLKCPSNKGIITYILFGCLSFVLGHFNTNPGEFH